MNRGKEDFKYGKERIEDYMVDVGGGVEAYTHTQLGS